MNLIALYLRDFNRKYLRTPADRRLTRQTVTDFLATLGAILLLAFVLYALEP
jgi:hypothetical protein